MFSVIRFANEVKRVALISRVDTQANDCTVRYNTQFTYVQFPKSLDKLDALIVTTAHKRFLCHLQFKTLQ